MKERVSDEDKELIVALYLERLKGIERRKEIKEQIRALRKKVRELKAEDHRLAEQNRAITPQKIADKFDLHKVTVYRLAWNEGLNEKPPAEAEG